MLLTFLLKIILLQVKLAIDSGQSLNWQTPDVIRGKE